MSFIRRSLFLTLVLGAYFSSAKVHTESPMDESGEKTNYENIQTPDLREQNLLIGPITPRMEQKLKKKNTFYPYRSAVAPRSGVIVDPSGLPDPEEAIDIFIGVSYTFPRYYSPKWEVGVDLAFDSSAHLHFSRKTIFNEQSGFRPFYRLGLGHRYVAKERFASLVNVDNYLFRAGAGIEDLIDDPMSIKFEVELAAGVKDIFAMINVGYSIGWL